MPSLPTVPFGKAAPVCSRHRVRLVHVQRLNPRLEQVESGRSNIKASVGGLVPKRDALSGLVIGTACSPQHRGCPYVRDHSPHAIPFRPRPETVIENNVQPQREATSPDRLHNIENRCRPMLNVSAGGSSPNRRAIHSSGVKRTPLC